jgi:hypothetical protein
MTVSWGRVLRERRTAVIVLAAALGANILGYFIVVRPLQVKSVGSADRAASAAANLVAAERELTQARALVSGKARADEELSAFYQKVLPADLTAARRMTYASLPALADRTHVKYEARTTTIDEKGKDTRLGHMTIRMVLEGDYRDIRQFIYQLETASDFVIIDDLTLSEGTDAEPQRLTINLSTYYRLGGSGG